MKRFHNKLRVLATMALLFVTLGLSGAQYARAAETLVNTTTLYDQLSPSVAVAPSGQSVIVWKSKSNYENYGIWAQLYDSSGAKQGGEFRVNTRDSFFGAKVAMDSSGNFIVTYEVYDGRDFDIYAQRFDSSGAKQGDEFRVNSYSVNDQTAPSPAMDDAGNFVIAWTDYRNGDRTDSDIYVRRFNSSGIAQNDEFRVNTSTMGNQVIPSVAMNASGNFVVSWTSYEGGVPRYIYAQRYASDGTAQGMEILGVYSYGLREPSVTMDDSGNFVIVWAYGESGIYAQRFNNSGVAQSNAFLVSTGTDTTHEPHASMDSTGNFIVAWRSFHARAGDEGPSIYGQRFRSNGTAKGTEFRISGPNVPYSSGLSGPSQASPRVAMDNLGRFIATWERRHQDLGYTEYDVYADRFSFNNAPVAKNQFESILEDTSIAIDLSAYDKDKDALTYSIVSHPTHGTLSGSGAKLTYTPAANYNGSDSFTYKANDGTSDSNIAKVSLAIGAVNDAPVAKNQSTSLRTNSSVYVTLVASDVDNANLTYTVISPPTNGMLTGSGNVRLYKPTTGYVGDDSFAFQVSDGSLTSNAAKVSITVKPNMAPIADSQTIALREDTPTPITLSAKDGDDNTLLYTVLTQPTRGTLTGSGQSFVYTPNANISGSDSFTFKVSDGNRDSNVAKISLAIQAVNDAPVAQSQNVTTSSNRAVSITLRATDADNAGLTYSIVTAPANGTLTGSGNAYRYTPTAGYSGSDDFTFKANDGNLDSNTASVSITVTP